MGRLQDLLNVARYRLSATDPMGQWAQEITRIVDGGLTNGSCQYGQSTNSAPLNMQVGNNLILDVLMNNRGLSYLVSPGSTSWSLTIGKNYLLHVSGYLLVIGSSYGIQWVNDQNIGLGSIQAGGGPCPIIDFAVGTGVCSMIYSPQTPAGTIVRPRVVTGAGPGTAAARSFTSVVIEIPGG